MDFHPILCDVVADVVAEPQKAEKVPVLFPHVATTEHLLDVCCEGYHFIPERHEDAKE